MAQPCGKFVFFTLSQLYRREGDFQKVDTQTELIFTNFAVHYTPEPLNRANESVSKMIVK